MHDVVISGELYTHGWPNSLSLSPEFLRHMLTSIELTHWPLGYLNVILDKCHVLANFSD